MTYEDIKKINDTLKLTDIKGKMYCEVNQRIKAFRMLYPEGFITTNIEKLEDGMCVIKASVGYIQVYVDGKENKMITDKIILGTGIAYEKENSTFINKTSYIENCETSAVGRALGMCGFGIDTSVASAEEVENAIINQKSDDIKTKIKKYGQKASELLREKNKKLSELSDNELQQLLETLENEN